MIKTRIVDGKGRGAEAFVEDNALLVSALGCPPLITQKNRIFRQFMTDDGTATGSTDMGINVTSGTDGACADHVTPFVFTSAAGGLDDAKYIKITDTGDGTAGIIGVYEVSANTDTNTVSLTRDPTDGNDEVGLDWEVVPIDFWVPAHETADRYITSVGFCVGYGTVGDLFEFSDSGAALTNGFRFYYEREGQIVDIHDAIKVNSDLLRMCVSDLLRAAWESRSFAANNDYGYMGTVNFLNMMPPYGLKLDAGSSQKLVLRVRDDNTDADVMNVVCYGFERVP